MNVADLQNFLPSKLTQTIGKCAWREILVGCSGAQVFRLTSTDQTTFYLKTVSRGLSNSLLPEKSKLEWLNNKLPVPKVLEFAENESTEFLLLSEVIGKEASDESFKENKRETIRELSSGLQMIHSVPTDECPFSARLDEKVEAARKR